MSEQKRKLTIAESLLASELPEDVKAAAIANHRALGAHPLGVWETTEDDRASTALDFAFTWQISEEGIKHWTKWWKVLRKKENEAPQK